MCVCVCVCVCVFPLTEGNELALNAAITYYAAYLRFITYTIELKCVISGNDNFTAVIKIMVISFQFQRLFSSVLVKPLKNVGERYCDRLLVDSVSKSISGRVLTWHLKLICNPILIYSFQFIVFHSTYHSTLYIVR